MHNRIIALVIKKDHVLVRFCFEALLESDFGLDVLILYVFSSQQTDFSKVHTFGNHTYFYLLSTVDLYVTCLK